MLIRTYALQVSIYTLDNIPLINVLVQSTATTVKWPDAFDIDSVMLFNLYKKYILHTSWSYHIL